MLLLPAAFAGGATCVQCCQAGGLGGCSTELQVHGEGSVTAREAAGWRVTGLWEVSCGGEGMFDPGATVRMDHEPLPGEVLMPQANPLKVHCVRQSCDLPVDTCLSAANASGHVYLLGCDDGLAAGARALRTAPTRPRYASPVVVVVDGKPLVAEPTAATPRPTGIVAGAPAGVTVPPAVVPGTPALGPGTPAVVPGVPAGASALPPDALAELTAPLPKDPTVPCRAAGDAVRSEARKRVDIGDERRVARDMAGAIHEYRAALSMDGCSAYGWLGLGQTAASLGRPDIAVRALENATRILPAHYGAWSSLGRAYEDVGQIDRAARAYDRALALNPSLGEALEGRRRTGGM